MPDPERLSIEEKSSMIEAALRPNGVLYQIAGELINGGVELVTPEEVCDVLVPQKDPTVAARWEHIHDAPDVKKRLVEEKTEEIFALADAVEIRQEESLPESTIARIASFAVCLVEGGANKTAIVRGALASEALDRAGIDRNMPLFYVATSSYKIPQLRADGTPNPERAVAQSIAPDTLPSGDVTQFMVTEAAIEQLGFTSDDISYVGGLGRIDTFTRVGERPRCVINPNIEGEQGTLAGLTVLHNILDLADMPLVLASNGQYRLKLGLQAQEWAQQKGIQVASEPVVLGDEAGFRVQHLGDELVTAARGAAVYVNEFVFAHRIKSRLA